MQMYYFFTVSSIFLSEILISDINHVPLPALFSLMVFPGFNLLNSLKVLKKETFTSKPIEKPVKMCIRDSYNTTTCSYSPCTHIS